MGQGEGDSTETPFLDPRALETGTNSQEDT